jgi:hypothetical protein
MVFIVYVGGGACEYAYSDVIGYCKTEEDAAEKVLQFKKEFWKDYMAHSRMLRRASKNEQYEGTGLGLDPYTSFFYKKVDCL